MHNIKEIENIFMELDREIREQTVNFFFKNKNCIIDTDYYNIEYTKRLFEYFMVNGNIDLNFEELEKIANETISYVNSTKLENFKEWNE